MCSTKWSNIPPQTRYRAAASVGASHPVPRTTERTGQTRLFRGPDTKSRSPLASCPLQENNHTMTHFSVRCSICSCFLWAEMFLFPVTLHSHHSQLSKTSVMPTYVSAPSQMSPRFSWVLLSHLLNQDPGLFCSLVQPLFVAAQGGRLCLSKGKSSLISNTEIMLSSDITAWSKERDMCPNGQVWEMASVKFSHRGLSMETDLFCSHKDKQKSALDLSPNVTLIFGFLFNLRK